MQINGRKIFGGICLLCALYFFVCLIGGVLSPRWDLKMKLEWGGALVVNIILFLLGYWWGFRKKPEKISHPTDKEETGNRSVDVVERFDG
jgi:uncharacterized membrane protein